MKKVKFNFAVYILLLAANCLLATIAFSQNVGVGINISGAAADNSALLDVSSSSKGILIPRVALTGINDATTIVTPATSLMVYCTGTGGLSPAGYYFNSGTSGLPVWTMFLTGGSGSGWLLTGNASTIDGTNFLGTTDNIPFNIRVNNQKAGRISPDVTNGALSLGYQAGNSSSGNRNTFLGYQAGYTNTTGEYNTAVGYLAMTLNDIGVWNTAFGQQALRNNSSGQRNTALGMEALIYNTSGSYNTSVGTFSTYVNNTGSYNTALGYYALYGTSGLGFNTAVGFQAGQTITSGTYNTLLGYNADVSTNNFTNATAIGNGVTATASNQIAIGNGSVTGFKVGTGSLATSASAANMFYDNSTGLIYRSTASGGSGWSLTGNAGTVDGTNFIGTTDASGSHPLNFKVNNQKAGRITTESAFLGYFAGYNVTTAINNVFVGEAAGFNLQTGSDNTAVGYQALYHYGAGGPTAGSNGNTAIGKYAMFYPYSGDNNVALGYFAYSLPHSSGTENTYIGFNTDASSGNPSYATALGSRAQANANNSTAIGYQAYTNVANTLILGSVNGQNGSTSSVQVGIGTINPQGRLHISHDYDASGASSRPNHIYLDAPSNTNLKGYIGLNLNSAAGAHKQYLGIELVEEGNHWANVVLAEQGGNVGIGTPSPDNLLSVNGSADKPGGGSWGTFSDSRVKKEVSDFKDGLAIVKQINPVTFKYNGLGGYKDDGKQYVGIIAQDIQKIAPYMIEVKKKKLLETDSTSTDLLMYDGSAINYILINAIKEQQKMIDGLKLVNSQQSTVNSKLQAEIEKIKQQLGMEAKR